MFEYLNSQRYFAQTQHRLEAVAREELEELGGRRCVESYCGVYFEGPPAVLYKINYCARTISRVLAPLFSFPCPADRVLYKTAYNFEWARLFSINQTLAIDANVSNSSITHSRFAALRLKDAIVDYFRKKQRKRPDIDLVNPDIRLNLNIRDNRAVISLDTSGESLHRRGYRTATVTAPLQETLAAAVIRLSGWRGEKPLLDPMCGSGTLLAEALMKFRNIPAAFKRNTFGFFQLPDFEPQTWKRVKRTCDKNIRQCPEDLITGSDCDKKAVKAARLNLGEIPGGNHVPVHCRDFRDSRPDGDTRELIIVTNPPYGIRMEPGTGGELHRRLGDFLKQHCKGCTAYILCGDKELTKRIGLKISRRFPLFNGPLDSRLVKIEVY
jgi:putative N6-adenine-specific DNA methylase